MGTDRPAGGVEPAPGRGPRTASGAVPGRSSLKGERRVVTALFCDVVGSTTLAEQFDPEDWAEIVNGAFQRLSAPVHRYEGTVARLLGDAILAFFGMPVAHEDDPQRSVLAALDMMTAADELAVELKRREGVDFKVRIGINTGPVVVADVGSKEAIERTALGDAVNVAARLEQTAEPGTIQVSGETYRLVAPLFDFEPLGDIELKGKAEKTAAYRVKGVKAQPGRLRGLPDVSAPLVGRKREFGQIMEAMHRLHEGRGGIICLVGEAGLGKSRLLAEARAEWLKTETGRWEAMSGIPYDIHRPFGLFQNFARTTMGVEPDDPAEIIHDKVVKYIRKNGGDDEAVALCSVAFERVIAFKEVHDGKQAYTPEVIRQDIYDNLFSGFLLATGQMPTVIVADDLHWADEASIDLLLHIVPLVEEAPLLIIAAFRPERQSPAWLVKQKAETDFPHRFTEITLKPLDNEHADRLVSELLKIANLPAELRALILRKADGNPYFVEEIVRTLIDQGIVVRTEDGLCWETTTRIEDISIPDSLQALLMARIDRLDQETRSTLQMAAVIGRSFYYRILRAISDSAIALDKHMSKLERVELLRETARLPEVEYMFRHELARDAAYNTILVRRRREFHQRVAQAMETIFADRIEEHAHRLAQHFEVAGDAAKALHYYEMAGDLAANLHAPTESADHYAHALDAAREAGLDATAIARIETKRAGGGATPAAP